MIYERGTGPTVYDETDPVCHGADGCVWYLSNMPDGLAREEAIRRFARCKLNSELGNEGEEQLTMDLEVTIKCQGPPVTNMKKPCHAVFHVIGKTIRGDMTLES